MTIFFYKEYPRLSFAQYLETGASTKFATNVSNEILLTVAKSQGYSVYRFWVVKDEPTVCVCEEGGTKRVLPLVISPPMKLINGFNNIIEHFWWQKCEAQIIE